MPHILLLLAILGVGWAAPLRFNADKQQQMADLVEGMKELLTSKKKVAFFLDFAADKRIDSFLAPINRLHVPYQCIDLSVCDRSQTEHACFKPLSKAASIYLGALSTGAATFRDFYHIFWVSESCDGKVEALRELNDMNVIVLCPGQDGRFLVKWLDLEKDRFCTYKIYSGLIEDAIGELLDWPLFQFDLMGCVVNVTLLNRAPAVIVENKTLFGWEFQLLNYTIAKLNGTAQYRVRGDVPNNDFRGLQTHVLAGLIPSMNIEAAGAQLTGTKVFGSVALVAPYIPVARFSVVNDVLSANFRSWLGFSGIIALFIAFCRFKLLNKLSHFDALMATFVFAYLYLEQSRPVSQSKNFKSWGFIIFSLFTLVINTSYRAGLSQMLTTHRKPNFIEEFEDLYKYTGDFTFYCRRGVFQHYKYSLVEGNSDHDKLKQALQIVPDDANFTEILMEMVETKKAMLFEVKEKVVYEISRLPSKYVTMFHIVRDPAYTVQFQIITGSYLNVGHMIGKILTAMSDNGITRHIVSNVMKRPTAIVNEAKQPRRSVSLEDISHLFTALWIGYAIAFAVFVCEHFIWWWNKPKFNVFFQDFNRVGPKNYLQRLTSEFSNSSVTGSYI